MRVDTRMPFTSIPAVAVTMLMLGCGGGSTTGGAAAAGGGAGTQTASGQATGASSAPAPSGSGQFDLVFEQSHQSCASCGIWFDSAELVVEHSGGTFRASQSGQLLIKQAPYHQGRFRANLAGLGEISSAVLYLRLNPHEGISNDDYTSSVSVYGLYDGTRRYVREITAANDIKGRGYSKANPVVPIDLTNYARQI